MQPVVYIRNVQQICADPEGNTILARATMATCSARLEASLQNLANDVPVPRLSFDSPSDAVNGNLLEDIRCISLHWKANAHV